MDIRKVNQVVIANDLSNLAENTLLAAIDICTQLHSTLVLMHVIEHYYFGTAKKADVLKTHLRLHEEASQTIRNLAVKIRLEKDIKVRTILLNGDPAIKVCRWSSTHPTDLIITGTHGRSGHRDLYIGSNAYRIVKHAPCDVMTIPSTHRWKGVGKVILVVTLPHKDASVCYDMVRPFIHKSGLCLVISGLSPNSKISSFAMQEFVNSIQLTLSINKVNFSTELCEGENISDRVLQIASREKASLIAISPAIDGSDFMKPLLIGPNTQQIINQSKYPVLCTKN